MPEMDYQRNVEQMLIVCGDPGRCKGCGVDIWWMKTRLKNLMPYNRHGIPHFTDCPKADEFRKKKNLKFDDLNVREEEGE